MSVKNNSVQLQTIVQGESFQDGDLNYSDFFKLSLNNFRVFLRPSFLKIENRTPMYLYLGEKGIICFDVWKNENDFIYEEKILSYLKEKYPSLHSSFIWFGSEECPFVPTDRSMNWFQVQMFKEAMAQNVFKNEMASMILEQFFPSIKFKWDSLFPVWKYIAPHFGSYHFLKDHEWCMHELSLKQMVILENPFDTSYFMQGVAGTGKTTLLLARCVHYCYKNPQKKALFLVFNKQIGLYLKKYVHDNLKEYENRIDLFFFHDYIRFVAQDSSFFDEKWKHDITISIEKTKKFCEFFTNRKENIYPRCKEYGRVFMDEIQDFEIEYFDFVRNSISHLTIYKDFEMAGDMEQVLYAQGVTYIKYLENIDLIEVFRSGKKLAKSSEFFRKKYLNDDSLSEAVNPSESLISINKEDEKSLVSLIKDLHENKTIPLHQIAMIYLWPSKTDQEKEEVRKKVDHMITLLKNENISSYHVEREGQNYKDIPIISSLRCRGLEYQVVIGIGFPESFNEESKKNFYILKTRARERLVLYVPEKLIQEDLNLWGKEIHG